GGGRAARVAGAASPRWRLLRRAARGPPAARPAATGPGAGPALAGGQGEVLLMLTRAGWSNPEGAPRASLQRVAYVLTDGRLERRVWRGVDSLEPPLAQVLLEDARDVRITFVASGRTYPSWPAGEPRALPDAVTLELTAPRFGRTTQWFLVGGGPG
ncbi:MAG: type II secretion system protein GspJ, partial [Brevundimonas sp.]